MPELWHDVTWVVPYRSNALLLLFYAFTALGYFDYILPYVALGHWVWRKDTWARIGAVLIPVGILQSQLKETFKDPRPPDWLHVEVGDLGYGFPSGHAMSAVTIWGLLALETKSRRGRAACLVLMFGQAFSRIFLGAHDLEDVVGGMALGALVLAAFQALRSERLRPFRQLPPPAQLAVFALILAVWTLACPPASRAYAASTSALGLGLWAGVLYERARLDVERPRGVARLLGAAALGLVGMFALRAALGALFSSFGAAGALVSSVKNLATGLWMTLFAPLAFVALGLSRAGQALPAAEATVRAP